MLHFSQVVHFKRTGPNNYIVTVRRGAKAFMLISLGGLGVLFGASRLVNLPDSVFMYSWFVIVGVSLLAMWWFNRGEKYDGGNI